MVEENICSKCKISTPCNQFSKSNKSNTGLQSQCKSCCKQYYENKINQQTRCYSNWKMRGIRFIDDKHRDKVYDIFINTDNCELCNISFIGKNPPIKCLDHIHINFKNNVRCVCCQPCNLKLGRVDRLKNKMFNELSRYYFRRLT